MGMIWSSAVTNRAYMLSRVSPVQLFATLWSGSHQAPLPMGSSWQKYWSGLLCPLPGDLPHLGIKPLSLVSPALQADSLPLNHWGTLKLFFQNRNLTTSLSHLKFNEGFYSTLTRHFTDSLASTSASSFLLLPALKNTSGTLPVVFFCLICL